MAIDLNLITDVALRDQLIALGITIPHIDSVLDPSIQTLGDQVYYKLLAMEAYTYEHSIQLNEFDLPAGVIEYQPFWTIYNTDILGYINHTPVSSQDMHSFIMGIYGFLGLHVMYGVGETTLIDNSDVTAVFNANGYADVVAAYSLSHFDDYVAPDTVAVPPTEATANNLTNAGLTLADAWSADYVKFNALIRSYVSIISAHSVKGMFGVTSDTIGVFTPRIAWDMIFLTLKWKDYIEGHGIAFDVPPQPTS